MKKFLSDLQKELKKMNMSDQEIKEILADHKEMIEEALKEGLTEEEISKKFGDPSKLAQELHSDSQKVNINIDDYTNASEYESVEGYKLFKTLPALELNEIQIRLISEDVEMYPYNGQNIEVHYKKDIKEENYDVSLENGVFKLTRNSRKTIMFERKTTPDFVVRYPNNGQLVNYSVETVSGDSELKGINTKQLRLKSTSGDFEAQGVKCELADFKTVSGDFEVKEVQANEMIMSAVSGDFECKDCDVKGNLDINTVSGDFELYSFKAKVANFKTVSGDLEGKEFYVERIDLKSVSGDINIQNSDKLRPITVGKKRTLSGDIKIN